MAKAVGVLLFAFGAVAGLVTLWGVNAGLTKGGEMGGLGVIAAIVFAVAGIPATAAAVVLGRLYWKWHATRPRPLAGISAFLAVTALLLYFAPVGNLPERYGWLAGAAPFAIHAVHAMVARR